jgi:Spy/CpxP family protein refolding chaperone
MKRLLRRLAPFALLPVLALPAAAVENHQGSGGAHQPYAALDERAVKALSPEETDALLTGKGFSQALAAELNGYPGPRHVLDFRDGLSMTAPQERAVQSLFDEMEREARALGRDIIAAKIALDTAFASNTIDEAALANLTETIGRLRGSLRATHLKYHLRTKAILSRHQVATYNRLRGYGGGDHSDHKSD